MFSSSSKKPYTAVTVLVERLTGPEYEVDDWSGVPDLVEAIRIQDTGPTEAARAIRKKLKYGNSHRQIRALVILDGLIQNAGGRFQRTFADEPLLERLRILPRDDMVDAEVRAKCNTLFRQWAASYSKTPGLSGIAALHKQLPTKSRPNASQSRVIRETERDVENENPFSPEESSNPTTTSRRKSSVTAMPPASSSSRSRASSLTPTPVLSSSSNKKDKKDKKRQPFNLEKEKTNMMQTIASASVASTNLLNGLKLINREHTMPSQDKECVNRFETCKTLRRQILRYIQLVESDQWIGSLLSANDELVKALMAFEILDKSVDDDSDSETEAALNNGAGSGSGNGSAGLGLGVTHSRKNSRVEDTLSNLRIAEEDEEQPPAKPPRPRGSSLLQQRQQQGIPTPLAAKQTHMPVKEDHEDQEEEDPFGDENAI